MIRSPWPFFASLHTPKHTFYRTNAGKVCTGDYYDEFADGYDDAVGDELNYIFVPFSNDDGCCCDVIPCVMSMWWVGRSFVRDSYYVNL